MNWSYIFCAYHHFIVYIIPTQQCVIVLHLRCQEEGATSVDTQIFYTSFHMIAPHLGEVMHRALSGFSMLNLLKKLSAEFAEDDQDFLVRSSPTGTFASAICDLATAGDSWRQLALVKFMSLQHVYYTIIMIFICLYSYYNVHTILMMFTFLYSYYMFVYSCF